MIDFIADYYCVVCYRKIKVTSSLKCISIHQVARHYWSVYIMMLPSGE